MDRLGGRIRDRKRRLIGAGGFALVALLTVFHGGLLWRRLADGSLLQPVVVLRWLVSVLLIFALLRLWRDGLPILRGRRAGVLWLVVVVLHAFTPGASPPAVEPVAGGVLSAAIAVLALLVLCATAAAEAGAIAIRGAASLRRSRLHLANAGWYGVLFSRPPPVALLP